MTRQQTLNALDHLDDALHHLQQAFIATGDADLLPTIAAVMDHQDELDALLPHTAHQLDLF